MVYLAEPPQLLNNPDALPNRDIMCIDCKSFYASVEAVKRGINPLSARIAVMSRADVGGGLVLAASPALKKDYHIGVGSRRFELSSHQDIMIVEPHMNDYIRKNWQINKVYQQFTDTLHWYPYSIDESFIDVSGSHKLFGSNYAIARSIQKKIYRNFGLIVTIGIGQNPLLAKLALDNAAKNQQPWIARWTYDKVSKTIWKIDKLTDMWGIGNQIAKRLNKHGIYSVYDLAHAPLPKLVKEFGILGEQLYYHAWGIDYSLLTRRYLPRSESKGYGNSQILMHDYVDLREIETVLREITDQVATRLRRNEVIAEILHLGIGYSTAQAGEKGFSAQMHIDPTNSTEELQRYVIHLFNRKYNGQAIRHIGIRCGKISKRDQLQLNLFETSKRTVNRLQLDHTIDLIRDRYGYKSLIRASSLLSGGTAISRSDTVGGHQA